MSETQDLIIGMVLHAPWIARQLVKKCRDQRFDIPKEAAIRLEELGLIEKDKIPEDVRNFILKKIKLSRGEGIKMRL